jgi:type II secretory pathway component GspD/PulD (secretin)
MSTKRLAMPGFVIALSLVATTLGAAQEGRPAGKIEKKTDKRKADDGKNRYAIDFERKPWKAVLEWFAGASGWKCINLDQTPTGTFTFVNPGFNGAPKAYTIPEIFGILNDGLAPLCRLALLGEQFRIVWANDRERVPLVTRVELAKRDPNEIVVLVVQLKTLNAEELAPEAKKFLGRFSEATPLPSTNELVLEGKVELLRRWLDFSEDDCKTGPFETLQHICEYVKASQAEKVLRDFLGDPKQVQPDGKGTAGDGHATMGKPRAYHIASDDRTNTIYMSGPPEKVEQARKLLAKFDVPVFGRGPIAEGLPTFQTYSILAGNAEAVAKVFSDAFKESSTFRCTATSRTVLLVYGSPSEQRQVATLLKFSFLPPANDKKDPGNRALFDEKTLPSRRDRRGRREPTSSSLEARLDRLIAEAREIRREVRRSR